MWAPSRAAAVDGEVDDVAARADDAELHELDPVGRRRSARTARFSSAATGAEASSASASAPQRGRERLADGAVLVDPRLGRGRARRARRAPRGSRRARARRGASAPTRPRSRPRARRRRRAAGSAARRRRSATSKPTHAPCVRSTSASTGRPSWMPCDAHRQREQLRQRTGPHCRPFVPAQLATSRAREDRAACTVSPASARPAAERTGTSGTTRAGHAALHGRGPPRARATRRAAPRRCRRRRAERRATIRPPVAQLLPERRGHLGRRRGDGDPVEGRVLGQRRASRRRRARRRARSRPPRAPRAPRSASSGIRSIECTSRASSASTAAW